MTDNVEWLVFFAQDQRDAGYGRTADQAEKAAAEITRLRAENERLKRLVGEDE